MRLNLWILYCILLLCSTAWAQPQLLSDTTETKEWQPRSLTLSASLLDYSYYVFHPYLNAQDYQATLGINKYFITVEYGFQEYQDQTPIMDYSARGNYLRIGADANVIQKEGQPVELYLGGRFCFGRFDEHVIAEVTEPFYGVSTFTVDAANVNSQWFEILMGLRGEFGKNLYTGYTFRWRFFPSSDGVAGYRSYYTPGFGRRVNGEGRSVNGNVWFNYYIGYRFDFQKLEKGNLLKSRIKKELERNNIVNDG